MTIDRPLRLVEVLAETIRVYTERFWASLGLGVIVAAAVVLAGAANVFGLIIIAVAFTVSYAAAARLVAGDTFRRAWSQVAMRLHILAVLGFVVVVPFALALTDELLLILAVAWLALTGFSIPVAMLESATAPKGWIGRLTYALGRSVTLARTQYLHAAGVAATLVLVYILIGVVLTGALVGFASSGMFAAFVLVQLVLAPFFFIGLSVHYFEQKARAAGRIAAERSMT